MALVPPKVTFMVPAKAAELDRLRGLDPDADVPMFSTGVLAWTVQTYIRLRDAGYPVELAAAPPARGIALVHADSYNWLLTTITPESDLHIVAIRADCNANAGADSEIVQNGHGADGRRIHHIPFWPQPGLIARDPARGARLEVATFKGFVESMHASLCAPEWEHALARIGVRWQAQETRFVSQFVVNVKTDWHDYEAIDAIVALRPDLSNDYPGKPASKLINAWRAGVPAVLGPEIAYRELRQTNLDFAEVTSSADALAALDSLRRSPDTYRAMVANGLERARQFSVAMVVEQWVRFIDSVLADFDEPAQARSRRENARRRPTTSSRASAARSG
jgi:hypothetical protein